MSVILAVDKFHKIEQNHSNLYVQVELTSSEHHSTNRAEARKFLKTHMGDQYEICGYIGPVYYRRFDGRAARANRYSAIKLG